MSRCMDDPRITTKIARELGYCTNCEGCDREETEDETDESE